MSRFFSLLLMSLPLAACGGSALPTPMEADPAEPESAALTLKVSLGKRIFSDTRLSEPAGQSCATCHDPARAFTDNKATSEGAVSGRFGVRNTPTINYARFNPILGAAGDETGYAGGLFWDGRTATLEQQAGGPMLNRLEMNNPDKATVVNKIKTGPYAWQFKLAYGDSVFNDVDQAFDLIGDAVAEYERFGIANRFSSRYDAYLAGQGTLTPSEQRGLALFEDPNKGRCSSCHISRPGMDGSPPLFTDFGYDNLGIPRKGDNPFYRLPTDLNPDGANYVDHGLSAAIHNPRQDGKFKAPTLRNIARTAPYGHNGYFATLRSVVDFYNTRDVAGAWPAPEVNFDLNKKDAGDLKLTTQEVDDLVAFMNTLSDSTRPGVFH